MNTRNTDQTVKARELAIRYIDKVFDGCWPDLPASLDPGLVRYEVREGYPSAHAEQAIQKWAAGLACEFLFETYRDGDGPSPMALALSIIAQGAGEARNYHVTARLERALDVAGEGADHETA
jgi:hypothetical protein